jgi:hypothetical protein
MPDNQADDFRAITDAEGMWFGPLHRDDLFRLIRRQTEEGLRSQASDRVGHVAFAFRAHLSVSYAVGTRQERVEAAMTFFFGNVDVPGRTVCAAHFDLHADAELNFNDRCFKERVMAFRAYVPDPPAVH